MGEVPGGAGCGSASAYRPGDSCGRDCGQADRADYGQAVGAEGQPVMASKERRSKPRLRGAEGDACLVGGGGDCSEVRRRGGLWQGLKRDREPSLGTPPLLLPHGEPAPGRSEVGGPRVDPGCAPAQGEDRRAPQGLQGGPCGKVERQEPRGGGAPMPLSERLSGWAKSKRALHARKKKEKC